MADNTSITEGVGTPIATREVTYSGDVVKAQAVGLVTFAGADDAKTVADVPAGEGAGATGIRVALATDGTVLGTVTETAPATDTASSGLNGRLQRIAQRLTSLIALLPAALGAGGGLKAEGTGTAGTPAGGVVTVQGTEVAFGTTGILTVSVLSGSAVLDGGAASYASQVIGGADNKSLGVAPVLYNGATYDRQRNNVEATLLASAARTATTASADQTNYNGRGVHVVLDMTTVGTGSVTLTIQGKDALSGKYYTILAGAAVTTDSTNVYRVYPGLVAAANAIANDIMPRTWRVNVVANNANSATYSVGVSNIL